MAMNIIYIQETNNWVIDLEETWTIQEDKELNFVTSKLRESGIPYFVDFLEGKLISLSTSISRSVNNTKEASAIILNLLLIQENLAKIKPSKPKQTKVLEPKIVPEQKPLFESPVGEKIIELDKALQQNTPTKNIFNRR
jgi:hypothetical protein